MHARPRRALSRRQHPRLHRHARRGRQAGLEVARRGRQDPRHRDAGVLRRDQLHGGQPDLAHPRLDRDPRLPAEAAARPDGAEAPEHPAADPRRHRDQPEARRLHPVHAGELPVPHQAAAERRQCARPGQVHVPEPALGLHARHAAPRAIRARRARLLERLHPAREAGRARRTSCSTGQVRRPGGGLRRLGRGEVRAQRDPRPADPGAHRLPHRLLRRRRAPRATAPTSTAATPRCSRRSRRRA